MKKSYPQGPRDWLCFFRNYPLGFNFFNFHARNRLPPGIGSCFSLYCSPWSSCYCIKAKYFSQIKSSERGHICPACRCGTVKWFSWNRPHREHFAQKPVLLEAGTCQSQNKVQLSGYLSYFCFLRLPFFFAPMLHPSLHLQTFAQRPVLLEAGACQSKNKAVILFSVLASTFSLESRHDCLFLKIGHCRRKPVCHVAFLTGSNFQTCGFLSNRKGLLWKLQIETAAKKEVKVKD